jgi:hypothetical protein
LSWMLSVPAPAFIPAPTSTWTLMGTFVERSRNYAHFCAHPTKRGLRPRRCRWFARLQVAPLSILFVAPESGNNRFVALSFEASDTSTHLPGRSHCCSRRSHSAIPASACRSRRIVSSDCGFQFFQRARFF